MVRIDDSGSVTKCWLDHDELAELEDAAARADWELRLLEHLVILSKEFVEFRRGGTGIT